ncbi:MULTISPECIES: PfkB family carbohydrate kinase [unclassified Empedobacter]|uniref:PfkB family carbohydrate kinase n=1 Tax=unclassified Empedobacter TaxID=2643773 RepID=UPI00244B1507|nr:MULTISPECIES: PfkB family carbohydrate kinase [unclassified Empedobacter]MDH0658243.1 PfkB family carbohydrate kinase [Empedobacter sp. GD03865]MDH1603657.1 PfkB family carbohydrate kinase [Empedobacter sp. GD03739]
MSLLTVGTVAFDKLESPFGKTDKILGGAATYIGMASSLLGVDTAIVSVVGGDFPQEYIDLLISKGINLDGLEIVKEGKTFFWEGKYHNDLNTRDTLATELNVLETFNPVVPQDRKSPDVLMLGNLHPLVQKGVLTQLDNRPGLVVLDTMNFWMDCAWNELMDVIKDVDVISINDEEARQMSGEYSLVKAAKKIMTFGPKTVIIKKGEHGALLFQEEQVFFAPALPLEDVFDPTGAGDTFAGGFSGYLAKTNDFSFDNMKRAIVYGSALASVTCEKFGTESLGALTRDGLAERLKEFNKLMDFSINL